MKLGFKVILLAACLPASVFAEPVSLANDAWPPFILEGEAQGKSERIVCQALEIAGHDCVVRTMDFEVVLLQARSGDIDGLAAAWKDAERETYMLFSESYLTNRIVPVVTNDFDAFIQTANDLKGLRVALVNDYSYGDDIAAIQSEFKTIKSLNSVEALAHVRQGRADVALVDELVARGRLEEPANYDMTALTTVLAFRSLHFAVSKKRENAQQLIDDFHSAYAVMLSDGTVNDILDVDWLATDFGQDGTMNVVMRSGVSLDDLDNPTEAGGMYALDQTEYQWMQGRNTSNTKVNYQFDGKSYSNLNTALNEAFGEDAACKHNDYTSTFDCTNLFKNRK